jgi:uncharacterized damage-inducible protein DinB
LRDELGLEDPLDATPEDITSWDDLQAHRRKVRGWMRRVIDESTDEELVAQRSPVWPDNPAAMLVSRADVLAHILLHERAHHGDVSTALSALGGEAPATDYLVYLFFKRRAANS